MLLLEVEDTSKENDYTALITSKAGTWELLINYFKQHYRNECTVADNLKRLSLLITQWVKTA